LAVAFAQFAVAVALAYYAYRTWKSADCYSRITGLQILLQQLEVMRTVSNNGPEDRRAASAISLVLREFPEIKEAFRDLIPDRVKLP
jgi:hypothetical protein